MKKSILLLLATTLSSQAFAWSITIGGTTLKGDDPKPIPQIIEKAKEWATSVSNGTRDAIAAVGNATGISSIVDSNKKVFVDIGTGYACLATLCYSEVVKKKQLEEAEQEAQEQMDRQVAEAQKFYNRLLKEDRIRENQAVVHDAQNLLHVQNTRLDLVKKEKQINAITLKALNTQTLWNDAMARQGVKERPALASMIMKQPTTAFEEKFNRDYKGAISDLNSTIDQLEASQKIARQQLMTEFVYFLNDSTLRAFTGILEDEQKAIQAEQMDLESKIRVNQAKLQSAQAKLAALNGN